MVEFDISKNWTILVSTDDGEGPLRTFAAELAERITVLRRQTGLEGSLLPVLDGSRTSPPEDTPIFILNMDGAETRRDGFSWRAGPDRVEFYGDSARGLRRAVFGFLAALESGGALSPGKAYLRALSPAKAYEPARIDDSRLRRYFLRTPQGDRAQGDRARVKDEVQAIRQAARESCDTVVIPVDHRGPAPRTLTETLFHRRQRLYQAARSWALAVEGQLCPLSDLVPRRYFLIDREIFRMTRGRRTPDRHFCPTNPRTIRLLGDRAQAIFRANPHISLFHLPPDPVDPDSWCSCPTCRAFSPAEQVRMALNVVADALAATLPDARLACAVPGLPEDEENGIRLRNNLLPMAGALS
jgi:hypothetical protein